MSEILIFGWVLSCIGSGVNKVTVDFSSDINNELYCRNHDIFVRQPLIACSSSGFMTPEEHAARLSA